MKELKKLITWLEKRRQEANPNHAHLTEADIAKLHTLNLTLLEAHTILLAAEKEKMENKQK